MVTCGVQLNSEHGKMTKLAASMDLRMHISRNNDLTDDFHLNMHQVICIGAQWFGGVIFFEMTTGHHPASLLNAARACIAARVANAGADGQKL